MIQSPIAAAHDMPSILIGMCDMVQFSALYFVGYGIICVGLVMFHRADTHLPPREACVDHAYNQLSTGGALFALFKHQSCDLIIFISAHVVACS